MGIDYQFWGFATAIGGIILIIIKMWLSWSERMAAHKEFVISELKVMREMTLTNGKDIEEHKKQVTVDMENVKKDRAQNVSNAMARIEKIENARESDVRSLTMMLEKSIEKTMQTEDRHHSEVMDKIEQLTIQLTDMCSTFKEYRNNRHETK